jgi:non-ribosomal peptide synthetase component F
LTNALKDLSRQENVTLFMTLLAGWQILLARYSGASESIVGTPIANRRRSVTESLIGFFVNTLVMRLSLPPEITFKALLKHVQEVALGAYAHQDLPFEMLVKELQPERHPGCHPLVQTVLTLQNAPIKTLELVGLTLDSVGIESGTSKFDIVINVWQTGQGLTGSIEYNSDLFDRSTITHMADHLERLLKSAMDDPDVPIDSLKMLSERESLALGKSIYIKELDANFSL